MDDDPRSTPPQPAMDAARRKMLESWARLGASMSLSRDGGAVGLDAELPPAGGFEMLMAHDHGQANELFQARVEAILDALMTPSELASNEDTDATGSADSSATHRDYRPIQNDLLVNLSELPTDLTDQSTAVHSWVRGRLLPAYRVPPTTRRNPGGDLWALRVDIERLAAGKTLEPPPEPDNSCFEVYVVELQGCDEHPGVNCLYVGQSVRAPRNRFIQHLLGYKSGQKRVSKWGRRLRTDLVADLPACPTRSEALELERQTARGLAGEGWAVHPEGLLTDSGDQEIDDSTPA